MPVLPERDPGLLVEVDQGRRGALHLLQADRGRGGRPGRHGRRPGGCRRRLRYVTGWRQGCRGASRRRGRPPGRRAVRRCRRRWRAPRQVHPRRRPEARRGGRRRRCRRRRKRHRRWNCRGRHGSRRVGRRRTRAVSGPLRRVGARVVDHDAEVLGEARESVGVALADGAQLPGAAAPVQLGEHDDGLALARRGRLVRDVRAAAGDGDPQAAGVVEHGVGLVRVDAGDQGDGLDVGGMRPKSAVTPGPLTVMPSWAGWL